MKRLRLVLLFLFISLSGCSSFADAYECSDYSKSLSRSKGVAVYLFRDYLFLPDYYVTQISIDDTGTKAVTFLGFTDEKVGLNGGAQYGLLKDFQTSEDANLFNSSDTSIYKCKDVVIKINRSSPYGFLLIHDEKDYFFMSDNSPKFWEGVLKNYVNEKRKKRSE